MATTRASPDFPPVRACLFDMDGLLLNTEDMYSVCANAVLARHGRPELPWRLKAQMMGVPGSSNGDLFHAWAQLPISRDQYRAEQAAEQDLHFPECRPLPGAERLLADLKRARTTAAADADHDDGHDNSHTDGHPVQIALASSSERANFNKKTLRPETRAFMHLIPEDHRVLGDDPRVRHGRGKPAPDIYLVALETLNSVIPEGEPKITPRECLVFEDSVPGVEAGRRAGMRVVWVPHPKLAEEFRGKEQTILAGRMGLINIGDEHQLGEPGDGWAEQLPSLENFPYEKFGIKVPS